MVKKVSSLWGFALLSFIFMMFLLSCDILAPKGSIEISIIQNLGGEKNFGPPVDINPVAYTITGTGSSGETFSLSTTTTKATISNLRSSTWVITVRAYNNEGIEVAAGSSTATVPAGQAAQVAVTIVPLSGKGTLAITLEWPPGNITNPEVSASVVPLSGGTAIQPSSLSVGSNSASLVWNELDAGSYTLTIQLKDGGIVLDGKAASVIILKDQTTTGSYVWTSADQLGGGVSVSIMPQMEMPLLVSINGYSSGYLSLNEGETLSLTASVSGSPASVSYAWYVNGINQYISTNSLTIGSDWQAREYQIDVIAIALGTGRAGSASMRLSVLSSQAVAEWARTVNSGKSSSRFAGVAVDAIGNIYAAGYQQGTDSYIYGSGVSAMGTSASSNSVLVKYDSSGTAQWARSVSAGSGSSLFHGVVVDAAGNVYAAGWQEGSGTYTYGSGVSVAGTSAYSNSVLIKYASDGTALWARTISAGSGSSQFQSVVVDAAGNVYAAGWQEGSGTYTYGSGVSVAGTSAYSNSVLVKYASDGTALWARTISAGSGSSRFLSIVVDAAGNVYAAGWQEGTGAYSYGNGVTTAGIGASSNSVLVKYDASGKALWAKSIQAGSGSSQFSSAAVDAAGNVYAAGWQEGTGTYTYGSGVSAAGTSAAGNSVLVKYASDGTSIWVKTVSAGTGDSRFSAVTVDSAANIFAAGYQYGTRTYTYGSGISAAASSVSGNAVLVKYNAAGSALWVRTVNNGTRYSQFGAATIDGLGAVYVAGSQQGTGFYSYDSAVSISGSSTSHNSVLVKYRE